MPGGQSIRGFGQLASHTRTLQRDDDERDVDEQHDDARKDGVLALEEVIGQHTGDAVLQAVHRRLIHGGGKDQRHHTNPRLDLWGRRR